MYFEMLHIINIHRYLQIPQVFPRGSCYESAKAIQSPYVPRVTPPPPAPGMATDKCKTPNKNMYVCMYVCIAHITCRLVSYLLADN